MNTCAETNLGLNAQALSVLALLAAREPDFAEYTGGHGCYDVEIITRAWYNGRARGFSLTMYRHGHDGALVVVCSEHWNTDQIQIDAWAVPDLKGASCLLNGPTLDEWSLALRVTQKLVPYGRSGEAADIIYNAMAAHCVTPKRSP